MKKKLAILLSAVMVAGVIPMTALAGTTTYVNKTVTVSKGDVTNETSLLTIKDGNNDIYTALDEGDDVTFTLELEGAEWTATAEADVAAYVQPAGAVIDFTVVSSTKATVEILNMDDSGKNVVYAYVPLFTKIKDKGDITVTVDGKSSVVSSATCTYAVCTSGSASAKIAKTVNIPETGAEIKDITISETTAGALDAGGTIKLKLSKNFKFDYADYANYKYVLGTDIVDDVVWIDNREIDIKLDTFASAKATEFIIPYINAKNNYELNEPLINMAYFMCVLLNDKNITYEKFKEFIDIYKSNIEKQDPLLKKYINKICFDTYNQYPFIEANSPLGGFNFFNMMKLVGAISNIGIGN